jgi:hypothetical protein
MTTTTLADPRPALWQQRRTTLVKLAELRMFRGALCGCLRCNDSDRIEELDAMIHRAVEAVDDLSNRICTRETPCTH